MEAKVHIKCPNCGKILSFKPFPNYLESPLRCPFCSYNGLIKEYIKYDPSPQPPISPIISGNGPMPPLGGNNDATKILNNGANNNAGNNLTGAFIECIDSGVKQPLRQGRNTIGRTAQPPKASIMFNDPMKHIGRAHAAIDVQVKNNGLVFLLQDLNSLNGTWVNNNKVTNGTIVKLLPGAIFKLAGMSFTIRLNSQPQGFPQQAGNDGATQLY
ncbi:MAG: FHA domain-containing protein [Muribaculaceae bacterium]|nr:FHA domain-containing protein [Muribaculaceae bacterium]